MKRNFTILAITAVAFVGVSCEQHKFENTVEVKETPIYGEDKKPVMVDEGGKLVQKVDKEVVVKEFGAKAFFYDEAAEKKLTEKASEKQ